LPVESGTWLAVLHLRKLVLEPAVIFHWHPAIPLEVRPVRWLLRLAHLLEATAGL
jgi:hypothetical protein